MDPFELESLEPKEGVRTAASGTERILIGLALVALLGGVGVMVANVLQVDFTAVASESPGPSSEASGTPRPTPEPRPRQQFVLEPSPPPSHQPGAQPGIRLWIRALVDLEVHGAPSIDTTVQRILPAGEAVVATNEAESYYAAPDDDALGWLYLESTGGWVATTADGESLVERYPFEVVTQPGWIDGISAGGGGFLARGAPPQRSDQQYHQDLYFSVDGDHWTQVGGEFAAYGDVRSVAWGPVGWLAVVGDYWGYDQSVASLHRSTDGIHWELLGVLPPEASDSEVIASSFGYLLSSSYSSYGRSWFSSDGIAWREMGDYPGTYAQGVAMAGIADGFLAWGGVSGQIRPSAAVSVDGRTWQPVTSGPTMTDRWSRPLVVQIGARVVALVSDPNDGAIAVWIGAIERGQLSWRRAPGSDASFAGAYVNGLVANGNEALAYGNDADGSPALWSGDGTTWTELTVPDSLDSINTLAADGATTVLLGWRSSLRGGIPVFWHRTGGGAFERETEPIFPPIPDRPADCGTLPANLLELVTRDTVSMLTCFGSTPITVRGWARECDWCSDDEEDPDAERYQPMWLAYRHHSLLVAPSTSTDGEYFEVAVDPSLGYGDGWDWQTLWVEITIHLDDPAARDCTYVPAEGEYVYGSIDWLVDGCRQTWVLDSIREVDGP